MKDQLISWIRTTLPMAWSLLVAWGAGHGLPVALTTWASGIGGQVTNLAVAGVLYGLARWVEPHLPNWLTALFFGSTATPTYTQPTRPALVKE